MAVAKKKPAKKKPARKTAAAKKTTAKKTGTARRKTAKKEITCKGAGLVPAPSLFFPKQAVTEPAPGSSLAPRPGTALRRVTTRRHMRKLRARVNRRYSPEHCRRCDLCRRRR